MSHIIKRHKNREGILYQLRSDNTILRKLLPSEPWHIKKQCKTRKEAEGYFKYISRM